MSNIVLLTDSYKASHYKQYPPKTEQVYSYFESRGGEFEDTVFFGLQYLLKKYLSKPVSMDDVEEATEVFGKHLGPGVFNKAGWESLVRKHDGRLPVRIRAVAEGTVVPCHNVLMTVENTDPEFYWLTNYLETLLVQVWYPTTVATISREMKKMMVRALESTGTPEWIDFKLHDFGFRGVSSVESSVIGGMAHLVNFKGTDTVSALLGARTYYGEEMAGFSIPASEHSTITSWGRDNELQAFKNMLDQYPSGLVACVSDSYDIYSACEELWGTALREQVLGRNGVLVVRPDSGDPVEVITRILSILGRKFGTTRNSKGYNVLDPHIRVIQGDGVDLRSVEKIIGAMTAAGWSFDNIAFGMGGALLQKLNRDTQKFAFKCSSIVINGERKDVFKDPIGAAWKSSKRGRLALTNRQLGIMTYPPEREWATVDQSSATPEEDYLKTVFENGEIKLSTTFSEVRNKAKIV
jgi:nicotinamide phosphoribosyltransferase